MPIHFIKVNGTETTRKGMENLKKLIKLPMSVSFSTICFMGLASCNIKMEIFTKVSFKMGKKKAVEHLLLIKVINMWDVGNKTNFMD